LNYFDPVRKHRFTDMMFSLGNCNWQGADMNERTTTIKNKLSFLALAAAFMLIAMPLMAQTTSVSGKVVDQGGGVVPGVSITLLSSTGAVKTTVTNEVGVYQFPQLPPGTYSIKAELKGFKTASVARLELLVDTPSIQDLKLEVGGIAETVTVEASAVQLNTLDATLGTAFEGFRVIQLPLESRNVANLLSLQAGVTEAGYVSGARSDQSNLTLDGIDVNEQQTGEAFQTVLRVNPDSLQEFRVTTASPNAAQGRSSGGQVSLVTKSGTNEFHGSLYEYHRNTVTTANDFFNNRSGLPRPKLIRNLFGGSLGGPIKKDRFFFFYNYEGRRDAKETTVSHEVPLASLGQGLVKYQNTSGGITALTPAVIKTLYPGVGGVNPAAVAALGEAAKKYPANDTGYGDGLNIGGFRFNAPLPVKYNAHTINLTYNLDANASHTLSFRGNYQHDNEAGAPYWPDTPGTDRWSHPLGFASTYTWTVSPKLVNTFRVGLTRLAFSQQGDSSDNAIRFRFVYWPRNYDRTLSRTTPLWNFVDDVAWVRGNHTWQFGANIRIIRNQRTSFATSYDAAVANPSFYEDSGAVLDAPISDITGSVSNFQAAICAVIGRYSQYSGNYNYGADGKILPSGTGVARTFGTGEYEFYGQDTWRVHPDLTLTLGLRYSLNTPVYETNGIQVRPNVSLGGYLEKRAESAAKGIPYNEPISIDLAGPANNRPGYYDFEKKNFAPRAAFAWQPSFENSFLRAIFGTGKKSVFRGGFAMTYDRIGSALAVAFDLNSTLGFSSSQTIAANTYNVSDRPGPLFTGFNQDIRSLPKIVVPPKVTFPMTTPADEDQRIESSLDDTLTTPKNYSWNFSIGREFGRGLSIEASYLGRAARNLLATRDVMQLNNLVDAKSGMDWYTAANMLYDLRRKNTPVEQVKPIPYFENLFPNYRRRGQPTATQSVFTRVARDWSDTPDWTYVQLTIDDAGIYPNAFFQPQYAALAAWSTVAYSDYHAGTLSVRERFKDSLSLDLNYTFSKSIDNASGLQTEGTYDAAFIENALRPDDNKSVSDFDITHMINGNLAWQLPIGRDRAFLKSMNPVLNHILGGWQLTSIFRWNSGLPMSAPFDAEIWATNWNAQSWGARIRDIQGSPTNGGEHPNYFTNPVYAYQSFRNARPGETGERNIFRLPSYVTIDFGLAKAIKMPWSEGHRLQIRWEVFNATNTQRLGQPTRSRAGFGLGIDPDITTPAPDFGRINGIQGNPRVMQFALRYDF
jgi:hypothetical protein